MDHRIDQVWTVGSTRMVASQVGLSRNSDPSRNNRIEDPIRSPDGNSYENKAPMSSRTFLSVHVQRVFLDKIAINSVINKFVINLNYSLNGFNGFSFGIVNWMLENSGNFPDARA